MSLNNISNINFYFSSEKSLETAITDLICARGYDSTLPVHTLFDALNSQSSSNNSESLITEKNISKQYEVSELQILANQQLGPSQNGPSVVFPSSHGKQVSIKDHLYLHQKKFIGEGVFKKAFGALHVYPVNGQSEEIVRQKSKDQMQVANIVREAELQKKFDHPCIVKVYDYYQYQSKAQDKVNIYSEKCDITLENALLVLNEQEKVRIISDVASALKYLHSKGYVHNDIKLDNILIKNRRGKLADFGLCNVSGAPYLGCIWLYPPENADLQEHIGNEKTDVYQFGLTVLETFHSNPSRELIKGCFKYSEIPFISIHGRQKTKKKTS